MTLSLSSLTSSSSNQMKMIMFYDKHVLIVNLHFLLILFQFVLFQAKSNKILPYFIFNDRNPIRTQIICSYSYSSSIHQIPYVKSRLHFTVLHNAGNSDFQSVFMNFGCKFFFLVKCINHGEKFVFLKYHFEISNTI